MVPYIVAQVAGAFGGAVLAGYFTAPCLRNLKRCIIWCAAAESLQLASIFSTYPAPELSIWHAALVEVVITSMLMGMIMALTDDGNGVPKGPLAPLLIGILVAVIGASTAAYRLRDESGTRFWPEIVHWFAGWGNIAMTGEEIFPILSCPLSHRC